jgi:hypothetical protein
MSVQFSVPLRNAQADQFETTIGTAPTLEIRSGAKPANCAAAAAGTLLVTGALPSDWLTAASNGMKQKNGTWTFTAQAGITETAAGHFRILAGGTCHLQGDCSAVGAGGDMQLDDVTIAASQVVNVNSFDYTRGNA